LTPRAHASLHVFSSVQFLRCQPWPQEPMHHFMCSVQSSSEGVSLDPKGPCSTSGFRPVQFLRCQHWPQGPMQHFMCSVPSSSEGVSLGPKGSCSTSCVQFSQVLKVSALAPRAHASIRVFSAVQFFRCQPWPQGPMQLFRCSVQSSS